MLVDREGLWYRMLKARYGKEGGYLKKGGGGVHPGGGKWLGCGKVVVVWVEGGSRNVFQKRCGMGGILFFLTDPWLGRISLAVQFGRLYDLCVHKLCSVGEMFVLGWEEGGAAWQ